MLFQDNSIDNSTSYYLKCESDLSYSRWTRTIEIMDNLGILFEYEDETYDMLIALENWRKYSNSADIFLLKSY